MHQMTLILPQHTAAPTHALESNLVQRSFVGLLGSLPYIQRVSSTAVIHHVLNSSDK